MMRVNDAERRRHDSHDHPAPLDECLRWLEAPDPAHLSSRGRYVTRDEAVTMIQALARDDRVAVDDLGGLETVPWNPGPGWA